MKSHRRALLTLALSVLTTFTSAPVIAGPTGHHWAKRGGGTGANDRGWDVVTGGGSTVFVGMFSGTADFAGVPLIGSGGGGTDGFICRLDPATGAVLSLAGFGSTGTDAANAVAMDASGNYYVGGYFSGTVILGLGVILTSSGGADSFVAKYAADNTPLWARSFGSNPAGEEVTSVAVDAAGNVYATGYFLGTASIQGHSHVSNGSGDIFILKLDPSGNWLNSVSFGGAGFDIGHDLLVDGANNVVMVGEFPNTVNFGGGNLTSVGSTDLIVAKYNSNLGHIWSQRFGGPGADVAQSVAANTTNEIYVTGWFTGSVDFGGGALVGAGSTDAVIAKYDPAGTHRWSRRFGGINLDAAYSVAVDAASNAFIATSMGSAVDFGGGVLPLVGNDDMVFASYSPTGTHRWSQSVGSTGFEYPLGIAADDAGSVYATGRFPLTLPLGGGLTSAGSDDAFMVKLSAQPGEPDITSITDIPNDQGRKVKIRFDRSGFDAPFSQAPITRYVALRQDAPGPSAAAGASGSTLVPLWTEVGSVSAFGTHTYGIDVPTIADSTVALGPYNSTFIIRAATSAPTSYFESLPEAGYSLDNLAPGIPLNFVYSAGDLAWAESSDEDFDYFTVYGSNVDAFGSAVIVDYTTALTMDVSASPYVFYFVTATDFSGNEGKPAKVNTLSGAGGTPKSYVLSVSNFPNPFNPRTTVSYTVPSRGVVRVAIYDPRGAYVATLFEGERPAGAFSIDWNPGATVSSGIYFARIEHNGSTRTKKMVLLK